jgi:hypothetical protein
VIVPRLRVIGAKLISGRFRRKVVTLPVETEAELEKNAQRLLEGIRARASGRPGPRVITGAYRASWRIERPGPSSRIVSTDHPAARRLERGFVGTDSLGRVYHQPPFPHVWPAADAVEGAVMRDMAVMVTRGL